MSELLPSGFKQTDIGARPAEWDVVCLEDIADPAAPIRYGVVQIGSDSSDGVPIVPIKHITRIGSSSLHRASPVIERRFAGSRVRSGDVLLSVKGTIGRVGVVPDGFEGNIAREIARIRPRNGVDPSFIAYELKADHTQRRIDKATVGSTRREFSIADVKRFQVSRPPLAEQRKIVEVLRTWDEAIEKLEALRAAKGQRLDQMRTLLMARGAARGRMMTFGDFLTESRIAGGDGATARKISVRLYGRGAVEKADQRVGSASTRYYRRKAGQIIWSKLDFLNGAFALVGDELDGCESTLDLPAFDCAPSVNPHWLIEYLTRPAYYAQQVHLARGQRKARRVSPDDWLASPVRLPDRADQDRIAETIAIARRDVDATGQHTEMLVRQKRGLMQKLLTGEWRVSGDAAVA